MNFDKKNMLYVVYVDFWYQDELLKWVQKIAIKLDFVSVILSQTQQMDNMKEKYLSSWIVYIIRDHRITLII